MQCNEGLFCPPERSVTNKGISLILQKVKSSFWKLPSPTLQVLRGSWLSCSPSALHIRSGFGEYHEDGHKRAPRDESRLCTQDRGSPAHTLPSSRLPSVHKSKRLGLIPCAHLKSVPCDVLCLRK